MFGIIWCQGVWQRVVQRLLNGVCRCIFQLFIVCAIMYVYECIYMHIFQYALCTLCVIPYFDVQISYFIFLYGSKALSTNVIIICVHLVLFVLFGTSGI